MYINYRQSETEVLDADKQSVKRTVELFSTVRCRTLEHAGVLIASTQRDGKVYVVCVCIVGLLTRARTVT